MKKFCKIAVVVAIFASVYALAYMAIALPGKERTDVVYARSFGNKTYAALTSCFASIGSSTPRSVVLDSGSWAATNSLDVSSNITLVFGVDSDLSISTGMVVNLDGVEIIADNDRIFPGSGIATGPIGNAFAENLWQDDRSHYLAPTWGSETSGLLTNLIEYIGQREAVSNAAVVSALTTAYQAADTNFAAGTSNGLMTYVGVSSNSLTNYIAAENFLHSNDPVQMARGSWTGFPFMGSVLAIPSIGHATNFGHTNNQAIGATNVNGFMQIYNITNVSGANNNYKDQWVFADGQFRATHLGRYEVRSTFTFEGIGGGIAGTNLNGRVEMFIAKNATTEWATNNTSISSDQLLYLGDASGPGKTVARLTCSGYQTFNVTSTNDAYEFFVRPHCTMTSAFATIIFEYIGDPALAK